MNMFIYNDEPFERNHLTRNQNQDVIASQLDPLYDAYIEKVQSLADRMWDTTIKPYLDESGYEYRCVNGEWWFEIDGNFYYPVGFRGEDISDDLLELDDQRGWLIFDILQTIVPGTNTGLCNFMPPVYPLPRK